MILGVCFFVFSYLNWTLFCHFLHRLTFILVHSLQVGTTHGFFDNLSGKVASGILHASHVFKSNYGQVRSRATLVHLRLVILSAHFRKSLLICLLKFEEIRSIGLRMVLKGEKGRRVVLLFIRTICVAKEVKFLFQFLLDLPDHLFVISVHVCPKFACIFFDRVSSCCLLAQPAHLLNSLGHICACNVSFREQE